MLVLVPAALALSLTEVNRWPVPGYVDGVGVAAGSVALLAGDHIELTDASGAVVDSWGVGASLVVARTGDTLACTEAGVLALPGAAVVDAQPCTTLMRTADGWATETRRGFDDGRETIDLAFAWSGAPLLAWTDTVIAASPGDTAIQVEDGGSVDVGGPIGGLFGWNGLAGWSRPDEDLLHLADGTTIAVSTHPGLVRTAEMDGDDDPEMIVAHDEFVGVVEGCTRLETLVPAIGAQAAVGDVDGDACDELVLLVDHEIVIYASDVCGRTTDADGDGFTPADGDCDDADPNVNPGAAEDCDGLDNNCDGAVDEGPGELSILTSTDDNALNEGDDVRFEVLPSACADGLRWVWSVEAPQPYLCDTGVALDCWFGDDGVADLAVDAYDTGKVGSAALAVVIGNIAPRVSLPSGCGSSTTNDLTVNVGDQVNQALDVEDPGDDVVTCTVSGGPPGLAVTDCVITWDVTDEDLGDWWVEFIAEDEDGGRMSEAVLVHVEPATTFSCDGTDPSRDGCCCGSSSATGVMAFGVLIWGRRRRG